MDLGLTGRVAIVAAASKGLRRAVAEELAREGARVGICARTASTLKEAAAHIQKTTGGEAFHRALDVTDSEAVTAFVAAVDAASAASIPALPIREGLRLICLRTPPEAWRAAVEQLLMCTVYFGQGNSFTHAKEQVETSNYFVGGLL